MGVWRNEKEYWEGVERVREYKEWDRMGGLGFRKEERWNYELD